MQNRTCAEPTFFVDSQRTLMRQVLNRIVPACDGFPAAGDLSVDGYVDSVVGRSTELKRLFAEGLAKIQIAGEAGTSTGFASLSDNQKDQVLRKIESDHPVFFAELVKQTYNGYYSNPKVMELLGPKVHLPLPLGYDVEPGNLDLLENVKKRGRVYRES